MPSSPDLDTSQHEQHEPLLPPAETDVASSTPTPKATRTHQRASSDLYQGYISTTFRRLLAVGAVLIFALILYRTTSHSGGGVGEMTGKRTVGYFVNWSVPYHLPYNSEGQHEGQVQSYFGAEAGRVMLI
jgi:hypothetical protein